MSHFCSGTFTADPASVTTVATQALKARLIYKPVSKICVVKAGHMLVTYS